MLKLKITIKINVIKCALNFFFYLNMNYYPKGWLNMRGSGGGSNFFNLHSNVIIKNSIDPLEPPPPFGKNFLICAC